MASVLAATRLALPDKLFRPSDFEAVTQFSILNPIYNSADIPRCQTQFEIFGDWPNVSR